MNFADYIGGLSNDSTAAVLEEDNQDFGAKLQDVTCAVRMKTRRFGISKTLTESQRRQAADTFDAKGRALSASKKLIDPKHPKIKAISTILSRAKSYWVSVTSPFPDDGVRLLKMGYQSQEEALEAFNLQVNLFRSELAKAVADANEELAAIKQRAMEDLGELYNSGDYPDSLSSYYDIEVEFPAIKPDERLKQISPALYEQEQQRIAAKFEVAVQLAEQELMEQLKGIVDQMVNKLAGVDDGSSKRFHETTISNVLTFFERFKSLNIGSNEELDKLVHEAVDVVNGVTPAKIKKDAGLREHIREKFNNISGLLDPMMSDKPKRKFRSE